MGNIIDGPNQQFAARVVQSRQKKGKTQEEVATSLGIATRNISKYENGHQFPRDGIITKLAAELGVDPVWLATGHSEEALRYLEDERTKIPKAPTEVSLLYIKDWESIDKGYVKVFNPKPRYDSESAELDAFVPCTKSLSDRYAAVRYPGMKPFNAAYPAGCIVIYEVGLHLIDRVPSGSDIIFRHRGAENEAGLRRLVREPGVPAALLVPIDPAAPFDPIPLDTLNIEIIGVVVQRVIDHRTNAS